MPDPMKCPASGSGSALQSVGSVPVTLPMESGAAQLAPGKRPSDLYWAVQPSWVKVRSAAISTPSYEGVTSTRTLLHTYLMSVAGAVPIMGAMISAWERVGTVQMPLASGLIE